MAMPTVQVITVAVAVVMVAEIVEEAMTTEEVAWVVVMATEEEVPLSNRLDALEAKLDALLARTSSG